MSLSVKNRRCQVPYGMKSERLDPSTFAHPFHEILAVFERLSKVFITKWTLGKTDEHMVMVFRFHPYTCCKTLANGALSAAAPGQKE